MSTALCHPWALIGLTTMLALTSGCGGMVTGDSSGTGGAGGFSDSPGLGGAAGASVGLGGAEGQARDCTVDADCIACEYHPPGDCGMICCTETEAMSVTACTLRGEAWRSCRNWSVCARDCPTSESTAVRCITGRCAKTAE